MCGICGLWLRDGQVRPERVAAMRDAMAHRGPDGATGLLACSGGERPVVAFEKAAGANGDLAGYNIGLGHRRLAIIDLVTGDQPMGSADRQKWVVFNGEIYNYLELRRRLIEAGHSFQTSSDTEVLLRCYEEYGTNCTRHLNGIFAFAIWDGVRRQLFLARDHFGVKPLYYAASPQGFVFGSEVKAILESGLVSPGLDLDALGLSLTFRYTPSPHTLFKGVHKLPPGASLVVDEARPGPVRFFAPSTAVRRDPSGHDWAQQLAAGMDRAVTRQMVSDVPIGLSLSSGVDSSALLAMMSRASADAVHTFTIGFGKEDDEVSGASEVAQRFSAQFEARRVGAVDYADFMSRYMSHMEEPVGNESAPAYFFVAEMARAAGVKVLLTGQGPDELFAGYDRHVGVGFSRFLAPAAMGSLRPALRRLTQGRAIGEKYARFLASATESSLDRRLLGAYTVFSREDAAELLAPEVHREIDWTLPLSCVEDWVARAPAGTALERMLWIDARTLLSDNLLLAEDKMAMAASVEARVPYLDLEFADLAESMPGSAKLRLGRRKHVFRLACAHWIGTAASRRRKIGFTNPMDEWLRGSAQQSLVSTLERPGSFLSTYARPDHVRALLDEHRDRRHDHTRKLFFLASLGAWHATFCE